MQAARTDVWPGLEGRLPRTGICESSQKSPQRVISRTTPARAPMPITQTGVNQLDTFGETTASKVDIFMILLSCIKGLFLLRAAGRGSSPRESFADLEPVVLATGCFLGCLLVRDMACHPADNICQESVEFLAVTLAGKMDSPIGKVLHKTGYLECPRHVTGGVSKTNSLHIAMKVDQPALLSLFFQRSGPPCCFPS